MAGSRGKRQVKNDVNSHSRSWSRNVRRSCISATQWGAATMFRGAAGSACGSALASRVAGGGCRRTCRRLASERASGSGCCSTSGRLNSHSSGMVRSCPTLYPEQVATAPVLSKGRWLWRGGPIMCGPRGLEVLVVNGDRGDQGFLCQVAAQVGRKRQRMVIKSPVFVVGRRREEC